jgi:hypothetical protein
MALLQRMGVLCLALGGAMAILAAHNDRGPPLSSFHILAHWADDLTAVCQR